MNKRIFLMLAVIALPTITGTTVLGQEAAPQPTLAPDAPALSDQDLDLFRKDVRSLQKQIVAVHMGLTDIQAENLWPVYDKYTAELPSLYDRNHALLQSGSSNYDMKTSQQADI